PSVVHAQQSKTPKRVLVLYWYGRDFPHNAEFDRSFQNVLNSAAPGSIEYYPEYLETDRFPGEEQALLLRDYLRQKYADRTIDVVVASGYVPLDFLVKYRDELFPNTPIVFLLGTHPSPQELAAGPGMTGIIIMNTYRQTVDLALRLHPGMEQVFIVSGTLEHDKKYEIAAREPLDGFQSRVQITYLTDLTPDDVIAKMKSLLEKSVVLYVWQMVRDQQGQLLEATDVLSLIVRSARVPIYRMTGSSIGNGIVGGYVFTDEANANRRAEIALR